MYVNKSVSFLCKCQITWQVNEHPQAFKNHMLKNLIQHIKIHVTKKVFHGQIPLEDSELNSLPGFFSETLQEQILST